MLAVCAAGDMFYVVEEGEFTIYDGATEFARVGPGSCFGELALLHGGPRAASVEATKRATVLALARDDFAAMLGQLADIRTMWRFEALRKVA